MKKEINKNYRAVLSFFVLLFLTFQVCGSPILADFSQEAPTTEAGPVINFQEESDGFEVIVNLANSVAGDILELQYDGMPICDEGFSCDDDSTFEGHQILALNAESESRQYAFMINHGLLYESTGSLTYIVWHFVDGQESTPEGMVAGPQSNALELTIDVTGPNITINSPSTEELVNNNNVISFDSDDGVNAQCSVDDNIWYPCLNDLSVLGDMFEFDNLPDGSFTLYVKDEDEFGNVHAVSISDIKKDTSGPVGVITSTPDGFITDNQLSCELRVVYNEAMDLDSAPSIIFGSSTSVFTGNGDGTWSREDDKDVWMRNYDVTDANEFNENITITSTGARDLIGNEEVSEAGLIKIDTKNPQAVITATTNMINKGELSQTIILKYGEEMNYLEQIPIINFNSSNWGSQNGEWLDAYTYSAIFIHNGEREYLENEFAFINGSISGGIDKNENSELDASSSFFTIDTIHPAGYEIQIDQSSINKNNHKNLSFSYTGAEVGAQYFYTISDEGNSIKTVSGNGIIEEESGRVSDINVSKLRNGVLTLSFYLINEFEEVEYRGNNVFDSVVKKMSSSDFVPPIGKKDEFISLELDSEKKIKPNGGQVLGVKIINYGQYFPHNDLKSGKDISKNSRALFAKIYKRTADDKNIKDLIALNFISFETKVNNRDLKKERWALGVFGKIFGRMPISLLDWNINKAIAYSEIKI